MEDLQEFTIVETRRFSSRLQTGEAALFRERDGVLPRSQRPGGSARGIHGRQGAGRRRGAQSHTAPAACGRTAACQATGAAAGRGVASAGTPVYLGIYKPRI